MLLKTASDPVAKALWYIESHFGAAISLESIEDACGNSRYHISRAFAAATGTPVMQYVRGRRLTEAARVLGAGAPDILAVALDAATVRTKHSRARFASSSASLRKRCARNDILKT